MERVDGGLRGDQAVVLNEAAALVEVRTSVPQNDDLDDLAKLLEYLADAVLL